MQRDRAADGNTRQCGRSSNDGVIEQRGDIVGRAADRNARRAFLQTLGSEAIWRDYLQVSPIRSAA
jgi:hypothetical protein